MLNWRIVCQSLGVWEGISFVVRVLWGLVIPHALRIHEFLEQILAALSGLPGGALC